MKTLITQIDCAKCEYVKQFITDKSEVSILDAKSPMGMAEIAYHKLMGKAAPILIVDNEVVEGALNIKKHL